jgi:hypothetical protein
MLHKTAPLAVLLLLATVPRNASACSIVVPGSFSLDPSVTDDHPPELEDKAVDVTISRGRGPVCEGTSMSITSCDDLGAINLSFSAASDDEAPAQDEDGSLQAGVGYLFRIVDGEVPEDFWLDEDPQSVFYRDGQASFPLWWGDGAEDEQEPFDFTLGITAIDLAGNTSDEIEIVLADPGREGGDGTCDQPAGCAHVSPRATGLALGLLGLVRRQTLGRSAAT